MFEFVNSNLEILRLKKALEYYADPENWTPICNKKPGSAEAWYAGSASDAELDRGQIARAALEK